MSELYIKGYDELKKEYDKELAKNLLRKQQSIIQHITQEIYHQIVEANKEFCNYPTGLSVEYPSDNREEIIYRDAC